MAKKRSKLPAVNRGYATTSVRKTVVVEEKPVVEETKEVPVKVTSPIDDSKLPNVTNLQTNQLKRARRFQGLANKKIDSLQAHVSRIVQDSSFHHLPNISLDSQNPKLYDELIHWAQNKTFLASFDDSFDSEDEVPFNYPHLPFTAPFVRQPQQPLNSADLVYRTLTTLYEANTYSDRLGFPDHLINSGIAFLGDRCTIPALLDYMLLHPVNLDSIPDSFRDFALLNILKEPSSLKKNSTPKEDPSPPTSSEFSISPLKTVSKSKSSKEQNTQKQSPQLLSLSDVSLSSSSDEEYMFNSEVSLEYSKLLQDSEIYKQLINSIQSTPLESYTPRLRKLLKKSLRRTEKMKSAYLFNLKEAQYHSQKLHGSRLERAYDIKCKFSPTFDLDLRNAKNTSKASRNNQPTLVLEKPQQVSSSSDDESPVCLEDLFSEELDSEDPKPSHSASEDTGLYVSLAISSGWTGKTPKQLLLGLGKSNNATISITYQDPEAKAVIVLKNTSSAPIAYSFTSEQSMELSKSSLEKQIYKPQSKTEAENLVATVALFKLGWINTSSVLAPPFLNMFCTWRDKSQMDKDLNLNEELLSRYDFLSNTLIPTEIKEKKDLSTKNSLNPDAKTFVTRKLPTKSYWQKKGNNLKAVFKSLQSSSSYRNILESRKSLPIYSFRNQLLNLLHPNGNLTSDLKSESESITQNGIEHNNSNQILELGHNVILIVGETGCGKTTQIPQFLVEDSIAQDRPCRIICTQPRRISAISVAQRVAQELGESPSLMGKAGSLVGYQIRLGSRSAESNLLIFCTLGVLLRRLENDPSFNDITHLVIDEIQERSLDSDFLLVLVRKLLQTKTHIKVVLMSATVDANLFSSYFNQCPVLNVPGRTYPVQIHYLEDIVKMTGYVLDIDSRYARKDRFSKDNTAIHFDSSGKSRHTYSSYNSVQVTKSEYSPKETLLNMREDVINYDLILILLNYIISSSNMPSGAVIIFLPGIPEIKMLHGQMDSDPNLGNVKKALILQAHSGIAPDQQAEIFAPCAVRKIVLATNVAETGITIPDATIVIDSGRMKQIRHDKKIQISHLEEVDVAQANAKQRTGRAGRVQSGICFRLYTKSRYDSMVPYQSPEMARLPLEELCLRIKVLGHQNVSSFLGQTIHPPPPEAINNSMALLQEVGALKSDTTLTPLGIHLSRLPVSVFIGKVMIFGALFRCLDPALTIAAFLSYKSPFLKNDQDSKETKGISLFSSNHCDFLSLYRAYCMWRDSMNSGGMKAASSFCLKHSMSLPILLEIENMKRQYLSLLISSGFVTFAHDGSYSDKKHREICGIPRSYNTHGHIDAVIKCILVGGLYPKILSYDPHQNTLSKPSSSGIPPNLGFSSRLMRVAPSLPLGLPVKPTQSSIHYKIFQGTVTQSQLPPSNYRHAVYFSMTKGKNHIFCDALSFVPSLPLLLFAKELLIIHPKMCIADNLRFKCSGRMSAAIMQLRLEFGRLLETLVASPFSMLYDEEYLEGSVLTLLTELLSAEI